MTSEIIETLNEKSRWRSRDVTYWGGTWEQLQKQIPQFEICDFKTYGDTPSNPYLKTVVRMPRTKYEQPVPVGVVSNNYTLAQHDVVGGKCFDGIREAGIDTNKLRCEFGMTELGEWMNLRIYFPGEYNHKPKDGKEISLRLECFNSVDGSSRLTILLGWLRLVCTNGMVIGETKVELKDIHNRFMNLEIIPNLICKGLALVEKDLNRLKSWENTVLDFSQIEYWVNRNLAQKWGKKAACSVYHICKSGCDVEFTNPFAKGDASEKPVELVVKVPGAEIPAKNLYDVCQALSWVASNRTNSDDRVKWQAEIPELIVGLSSVVKR